MNIRTGHNLFLGTVAFAALLGASAAQAQQTFQVSVDTAPLIGHVNSPFYLDFQLNWGSGPGNNASVSNFSFGGGSAVGTPNINGLASGDLFSSVALQDNSSSQFNELFQGFTPGTTLTFDVSLSENQTGQTPDGFAFAILDNSTGQIPTSDPADGLSLVFVNIRGPVSGLGNVNTYVGVNDPIYGDYTGVTASVGPVPVPEPSTVTLGVCGLALAAATAFARRRQASV
ncbi:MAG TPA: NF038129 family PEP-CTERM protein [Pseudomonadales bacterium]|nr:NF038129 family PEP-CTERM protein [Pseudomonadales bacterium]